MKATVDKDLCIGCGMCVEICPDVFRMGADDKSHVKVTPVPANAESSCRNAADNCPTSAINIDKTPSL